MKIYVMRHGQTESNAMKCVIGINEKYSLTKKGEEQAKEVRNIVSQLDYDFIICSPLERAERTCEIVNIKNKKVIYEKRIMERNAGELEGRPKASLEFPYYSNYWNYYYEFGVKGITPIRKFVPTIWNFLDEIKKKYPNKKILIVTHNGVCRAIGAYFYGIPEDGDLNIYAHNNCEIKEYTL